MTTKSKYIDEVSRLLANQQEDDRQEPETPPDTQEPIQDVYIRYVFLEPGADQDEQDIVDSTLTITEPDTNIPYTPPMQPRTSKQARDEKKSLRVGLFMMSLLVFLCLASLALQLHFILYPPIVQITIVTKSQEASVTATVQTGRTLAPIQLSQSASVPTTGRGHQDPKHAFGFITFYNGQLHSVFIPSGTEFTGQDGVQIIITQDANIPAGSPSTGYGAVTVTAQAVNSGTQGNIPAKDINAACCATAVVAANLTPFSGGQEKRDFQFVTKTDIENAATPLKAAVTQSVTAALQSQLKENEQLQTLPCAPQTSADHQINEEATSVKVTATLTCSAVAYNQTTLQEQATQLLTTQALKKLGSGYYLLGTIQVTVTHAIPTRTTPTLVLSLSGIFTHALSSEQQQHIKDLVKGKTYQEALHILVNLPGIENVSLAWDENTKLPKDAKYIHVLLISGI